MVDQVDELLLKYGRCGKGDIVVITGGSPPGVSGSTNLVRVHHMGQGAPQVGGWGKYLGPTWVSMRATEARRATEML